MSSWKYIIVRMGNREVPVIFPESLVHRTLANAVAVALASEAVAAMPDGLRSIKQLAKLQDSITPVAAGSVNVDFGPTSGRSETLGVGPREHDTAFMQSYSYHHGILPETE